MAGRRTLIGVVLAGATAWSAPACADAPSFPTALDATTLTAWLKRETDITPVQVVAVSPSAVTAVISIYPTSEPKGARVVVRAEAVSAEAVSREGVLSWHVSVSADCAGHKVRLGETTGYEQRNLIGSGHAIRPPETDWRVPQGGTPLDSIWRLACHPTFERPLAPGAQTVAMPARPVDPTPAIAGTIQVAAPTRALKPAPVLAPAAMSGATVQISASTTEAQANADLDSLRRLHAAEIASHTLRVERADVNGRTFYRAVVAGFASAGEAARACEALKTGGQPCFVRPR